MVHSNNSENDYSYRDGPALYTRQMKMCTDQKMFYLNKTENDEPLIKYNVIKKKEVTILAC